MQLLYLLQQHFGFWYVVNLLFYFWTKPAWIATTELLGLGSCFLLADGQFAEPVP